MSFFAHHRGLLSSSLAEQGVVPLILFTWLLEHADEDGVVRNARARRIANELSLIDANLFTLEAVTHALESLQQPDPESKRRDFDGQRVVPHPTEGAAFFLPTFSYYNDLWMSERRKSKAAARQRRFAARKQVDAEIGAMQSGESPARTDALLTPPDVSLTPSVLSAQISGLTSHTSSEGTAPVSEKKSRKSAQTEFKNLGLTLLPPEWLAEAEALGFSRSEASAQFDLFADYWRAEGKLKADWIATWRNWLRRSDRFSAGDRPKPTKRGHVPLSADAEKIRTHKLAEARQRQTASD